MISYLIVGSGYRSEYYARIAAKYPDLFRAMFLCRSREKAELVQRHTGVAATVSLDEALAFEPDFVVVAVDREHVADVTIEWAERGFPVVAETPVGASLEKLKRIWTLSHEKGARIVSCEQYHRYPVLANGLALVKAGQIGQPVSAYLSLAHDYHGISLIRRMLLAQGEAYELHGLRTRSETLATDSRYGAILDGSLASEERDQVHIAFSSGKTAIYDFASLQYRSFIRSRHLTVRGERGEWSDRIITYADEENCPRRLFLMPEILPAYRQLDTQALRDIRKTWEPELFLDTQQDEFAIASILLDMEAYLKGGASPYPIEEALDDGYFWLLLNEAVKRPWETITAQPMPWNRKD
ncbi:MAG: Gfo/Idh/MocA family oxidoreductase [Clostridia bacterium]|nr:Gfo/Idh/MocA family oxidoreductase [Clostridia bacterium]